MSKTTAFLKRHSLVLGIALMFLLTWPIDLANSGLLPLEVPFIVSILIGWGIVIATLIMTGLTLGRVGVVSLLKRFLLWRVGWKWYLASLLLGPVLIFGAVYLYAALTGVPPDYDTAMVYKIFSPAASLPLLILPWFLYEVLTNGEEIGWRGYVLPRLQAKHSALVSSLITGVIWAVWHLPRFLTDFDPVHFGWFMVHVLGHSIILTWIYNNTRGSLLLVTLSHASTNTAGLFAPMANTVSGENFGSYILYGLLECIVALVIVLRAGPARLSQTEEKQIQGDSDEQVTVHLQEA